MDVVLWTVFQHFARRQRWAAALNFFVALLEIYIGEGAVMRPRIGGECCG